MSRFDELIARINEIKLISEEGGARGFFGEEVLRFISISGTLKSSGFKLNKSISIDERYITHILSRSLIEVFFRIMYIFHDPSKLEGRFDEYVSAFKSEYAKMLNEEMLPYKDKLEPAGKDWNKLKKEKDLKSILNNVPGYKGGTLEYLYLIYRVSSFDVHGRNKPSIAKKVFSEECNFPVLDVGGLIEIISEVYLNILNRLNG